MSIILKFLNQVVKYPKLSLLVIAAITACFAANLPRIQFSSSVENFFISGDPDKAFFEEVKQVFGHDGITVVAMVSPGGEDIFTRDRLMKLSRVSEDIEAIPGVRKVLSLTNVKRIYGSGMQINVSPLIAEVPAAAEQMAALKNAVSENPMYDRNIVSADRRTAAINVFLDDFDQDEKRYYEIMDRIAAILNREEGPEKFYVCGIAATSTATHRAIIRDLQRFLPLTFVLIIIILFVSFRSVRGVVLPLLTVVVATTWSLGFMALIGVPISMITVVLPPQIVAIGSSYAIYIMSDYLEELTEEGTREEIVSSTLSRATLPLLLCALTTVIGFGSLIWNRIPSLRGMGIAAVFGISVSVILSLTLVPAVMAVLPKMRVRRREIMDQEKVPGLMDQFIAALADFDIKHRVAILVATVVVCLVAALGMFRIEFDTDFLRFFKSDDPVTVANNMQQKYLAGAAPFFVILDAKGPDAFKDPALLRRMELFQNWMTQKMDGVDLTLSLTDYIKLLNRVFHKNDPAFYRIPETQKEIAQLLLFYTMSGDQSDFSPYVNGDYSKANIMIRTRLVGSNETKAAITEIEEYAAKWFGKTATVKVAGTIYMINKSAEQVAAGQISSIFSCVALIFVVMSIFLLSARTGFIAMLPNIVPILILFGIMGWFKITLNFSTSLIACIALGNVVDDTVHTMSFYNDQLKTVLDPDEAMRRTMKAMSKPAIYTSLSLFCGFTILAASDFVPVREFGWLTGLTIMIAIIGDQVMLPALLSTVRITTLWDYVGLKIGKQSSAEIRLFQGLSAHQQKVATLMGVFGFYSPGEEILKAGETCKDFFVVLEGAVTAGNGKPGQNDIAIPEGMDFGTPPGLPPEPSARTYIAAQSAKLLVLNPRILDRLAATHPKIAERVFANLERIKMERAGGNLINAG